MSATRDKTQKVAFVYSNLYQIYRKGSDAASTPPEAAPAAPEAQAVPKPPGSGKVIKAEDLNAQTTAVRVEKFEAPELLGKRIVQKPAVLKDIAQASQVAPEQNEAIESLKDNLKQLNDLHARLRFMLKELEDLVKE